MKNLKNIQKFGRDICTENLNPKKKVYGEKLLKKHGKEFRVWDPYRSKLSSALRQGLKNFPFNENSKVLYLGAGNGTTASHISDIAKNGLIYCIEFSPRAMTDLYSVCKSRKNMIPILADANKPELYMNRIGTTNILYQDIAQKFQVDILKKNSDMFLNLDDYIFLMVKARSVDVTMEPEKVFKIVSNQLLGKFKILEKIRLDPFEKDHMCIVLQKNG